MAYLEDCVFAWFCLVRVICYAAIVKASVVQLSLMRHYVNLFVYSPHLLEGLILLQCCYCSDAHVSVLTFPQAEIIHNTCCLFKLINLLSLSGLFSSITENAASRRHDR